MNSLGLAEILVLAGLLIFLIILVIPVAYQAYRRGYNPIIWGLFGLFALNPIFPLVILALVPHRSRLRLREQYTRELDEKLTERGGEAIRYGTELDKPQPETHSLGDRATEHPYNRSIGDDQTRL